MLSKSNLYKPHKIWIWSSICPKIIYRSSCNMNESSQLPDWVKSSNAGSVDDDDFVLPSSMMNHVPKVQDCSISISFQATPSEGVNKDVDMISTLLKNSYASADEVVKVLGKCNFVVRESLVEKVTKRFSNDWISAFGFFKWCEMQEGYEHTADLYDSMVDILGKAKMFDVMWDLVVEMVRLGGLVSFNTMSKVMRRLARGGRYEDAVVTFREIGRFGLSKDIVAINVLLDALCKERGVEYALDAFIEFKSEIPPNAHTFNVLIHGCCKARWLDKAQKTLEEMVTCGIAPCAVTYTSLIEAYCREKDFSKAEAMLDKMQLKGCPPNVVTYTIVMHSLGKANKTYEALGMYERMKRSGCVPDASVYSSLIYILSKGGLLEDANCVYEEMCKSGCMPDVTTYNTLISAACDISQIQNALRLLWEMEERQCKPDLKTYAPLLKICCRQEWMKILFFLLSDMFKKDISIDLGTYCLLVNGFCKSENLEKACLFFEEIVLKGLIPWSSTYNRLIEHLKRKNMEEEREKIEQLMVKAESVQQPG